MENMGGGLSENILLFRKYRESVAQLCNFATKRINFSALTIRIIKKAFGW